MGLEQHRRWLGVGLGVAVLVAGGLVARQRLDERAAVAAEQTRAEARAEAAREAAAREAAARTAAPVEQKVASRARVQAINRMNEGIQLFERNAVADAERALQDAITIDPTYAAAHHTLGQVYKKLDRLLDAEKALQAAVAAMTLEPQGEYYYDLGAVQSARGDADGVTTSEREAQHRAAIGSFQEALKIDPNLHKAHYRMGMLYEKLDEPKKADAAYRKTIELQPSYIPAFVSLGNMYIDHGDITAAMAILEQGAQLNGRDPLIWNGLGRAHFTRGQMQEAADAFAKAKAIDPDGTTALYGLGMAHAAMHHDREARANLELFLARAGSDTQPDLLRAAQATLARLGAGQ